jgi:hypothetical protein
MAAVKNKSTVKSTMNYSNKLPKGINTPIVKARQAINRHAV